MSPPETTTLITVSVPLWPLLHRRSPGRNRRPAVPPPRSCQKSFQCDGGILHPLIRFAPGSAALVETSKFKLITAALGTKALISL